MGDISHLAHVLSDTAQYFSLCGIERQKEELHWQQTIDTNNKADMLKERGIGWNTAKRTNEENNRHILITQNTSFLLFCLPLFKSLTSFDFSPFSFV